MKEKFSGFPPENFEISPRKKWIEMSKFFHQDKGGGHEMMVKLNSAYEVFEKEGDSSKLDSMYADFKAVVSRKESGSGINIYV